jgi:hypothetical protein
MEGPTSSTMHGKLQFEAVVTGTGDATFRLQSKSARRGRNCKEGFVELLAIFSEII